GRLESLRVRSASLSPLMMGVRVARPGRNTGRLPFDHPVFLDDGMYVGSLAAYVGDVLRRQGGDLMTKLASEAGDDPERTGYVDLWPSPVPPEGRRLCLRWTLTTGHPPEFVPIEQVRILFSTALQATEVPLVHQRFD